MDELRKRIEKLIKEMQRSVRNRNMNEAEYARCQTLYEILDLIDEVDGE